MDAHFIHLKNIKCDCDKLKNCNFSDNGIFLSLQANIHSIMGSEDQVHDLMALIDKALLDAETVEEKLSDYDNKLQGVKDLMEIMSDKDTLMQTRNTNHQALLEVLDNMVTSLDLESKHEKALREANFSTPRHILECTEAAAALRRCRTSPIPPGKILVSDLGI